MDNATMDIKMQKTHEARTELALMWLPGAGNLLLKIKFFKK
jgi:hypothetical protein